MKPSLRYLLILFVCSFQTIALCQSNNDFLKEIDAKKTQMIITLNNGNSYRGMGYIVDNDIYFTRIGDKHTKIYNDKDVTSLDMRENGKIVHFDYRYLRKGKQRKRLLRLVSSGKIDVYLISNTTKKGNKNTSLSTAEVQNIIPLRIRNRYGYKDKTFNPYLFFDTELYYIGNGRNDIVSQLNLNKYLFEKKYKDFTTNHFVNCPELVERMKDDFKHKEAIVLAIDFYNNSCN